MTADTLDQDDAASHSVGDYLRQMAEVVRLMQQRHLRANDPRTACYASYYEALLDLGQPFVAAPRPKGLRKQRNKLCYRNSTRAMFQYGYAYVEGYAMSEYGIVVEHAWNVEDGVVVDLTWKHPEKASYWGIIIPQDILGRLITHHGMYGVLYNDWLLESPLLQEGTLIPSTGLPARRR